MENRPRRRGGTHRQLGLTPRSFSVLKRCCSALSARRSLLEGGRGAEGVQGPPRTPLSLPRSGQEWRRASTWVRSGKFQPWVCPGRRPCSVSPRTQRLGGSKGAGGSPPALHSRCALQRHQLLLSSFFRCSKWTSMSVCTQQVLFHALPGGCPGDEGREPGHPQVIPREGASPSTSEKRQEWETLTARVGGIDGGGGTGGCRAPDVQQMAANTLL